MSVLTLDGEAINWAKPPKATTRVMWSRRDMYGRKVTGSLRTIAGLDRLDALSVKKFGVHIVVIQPSYNTGVKASAGTHDYDACLDVYIPGVAWATQEKFFRANGAGAYWRRPPLFGNHIHMFILPVPEGKVVNDDYAVAGFKVGYLVPGQLGDYYAHRNALANHAKDTGWFPPSIKATVYSLPAYIKAHAPSKTKPTVRWFEHRHLNTHGDDGATGTATVSKRRPQMMKDLTAPKGGVRPEVITLNEVKADQVAGWKKAFKAEGYDVPLAAGGNLVAVEAGTEIGYAQTKIMPAKVQGEGRDEAVGLVRAKINGHWEQIIVTHLDYRQAPRFDNIRVAQAKWTISIASRLAKYKPITKWKERTSIAMDENSPAWVRDKAMIPGGFEPVVKVGIDGIYSARPARSTMSAKTASDHPIVGVTYGKAA